jgi:hypothetical protein
MTKVGIVYVTSGKSREICNSTCGNYAQMGINKVYNHYFIAGVTSPFRLRHL